MVNRIIMKFNLVLSCNNNIVHGGSVNVVILNTLSCRISDYWPLFFFKQRQKSHLNAAFGPTFKHSEIWAMACHVTILIAALVNYYQSLMQFDVALLSIMLITVLLALLIVFRYRFVLKDVTLRTKFLAVSPLLATTRPRKCPEV